jgi:pimeloyl-ACP methyl ester carboxylesterase
MCYENPSTGFGRAARAIAVCCAIGLLSACAPSSQAPAMAPQADLTFPDAVVRKDLRFPCGPAVTCAGWLYLPPGAGRPPVVVMGNGFSGTRDVGMPVFAETFARHGLAAFAFDYRYFGASGGSPRQLINPWDQLDDWRSALAFVRTLDQIDGKRLAIWGTSMGGGLVLITGAADPDVRAIVAQVPAVDADADPDGLEVGLGWGIRLLFTAWADLIASIWSDEPMTIAAFAPSGEFGMLVDDQSYSDIQPMIPQQTTWQNSIAARSFTTFDDYNPAVAWADVRVPTLVVATRDDRLAPFSAVEAFAASNPNVTLETFEGGHFDIYQAPTSDWAAPLEAGFLKDVLK